MKMKPTVKLVSWTTNPIQTIYYLWLQSKSDGPLPNMEDIDITSKEVLDVFKGVIESHIPVSDSVSFVFALENISVSFREQMVRHRVGQTFGGRIGVDIVPDIGYSSWWGQSMRILDMGKFAEERRYRVPDSLDTVFKRNVYHIAMQHTEAAYRSLVEHGVPREDARDLIPLGATHRFSWTINLTALRHVIGKRGCWIPQLGLWKPIIYGMIEELSSKIHPYFRSLINPPCIKDDKFHECVYQIDNKRRITGLDETPPCPMYIHHHGADLPTKEWIDKIPRERINEYAKLWQRNPWTGERLKEGE